MKENFVGSEAYLKSFQTSKMKLFEKINTMELFPDPVHNFVKRRTPSQWFSHEFSSFFFRSAILQHTSVEPYFEDPLALYETAEPK